jgi:hypothetical protein
MRALSPAGRGLSLVASWLLAASPLWVADLAHAQWKWRDASGRVTASDLPPPREVPDKDILQRPTGAARKAPVAAVASSAPVSAAAASLPQVRASGVDKDLEARKKLADQQREAKAKADADKLAATRAENCKRARRPPRDHAVRPAHRAHQRQGRARGAGRPGARAGGSAGA